MNLEQFQTTDLSEIRQTIAEMIAETETLTDNIAKDFEDSIMSVSMVNPALEAILEDLV